MRCRSRILALLVACFALTGAQAVRADTVIHVAPGGDDAAPGTADRPVRTPHKARDLARTARAAGPVAVRFAGGTYYLSRPLVLTAEDTGTATAPITYAAAPEAAVIWSGGTRLDLAWEPHQRGIVRAKVPAGLACDELFVNGKRMQPARYPNFDPALRPFGGTAADAIAPARVKTWANPVGAYVHALHAHEWGDFHYRITGVAPGGEPQLEGGWQNNRRMGMHARHRFVENVFEELDAPGEWFLDSATATLYLYPPAGVDLKTSVVETAGLRHLVEVRGTADRPVRFVTFRGLGFTHTARTFMETKEPLLRSDWTIYRGGAVVFEGAEDCGVADCVFDQVGGNAVFVNRYNRRVRVAGCKIDRAGASGVCFVGNPAAVRSPLFEYGQAQAVGKIDRTAGPIGTDYPAECVVSDCLIAGTGRAEKQSAGVQIAMAEAITVAHCSIYDVPRAGVNIGDGCWGGHVVEFCDVFDTVQETGDHGSFNSWGRDRYWLPGIRDVNRLVAANPDLPLLDARRPTVLRNNRWRCDHGWDIDLDDGSSNYVIENNLSLRGGIKLREGFARVVRNNIMVGNSFHPHVWFDASGDVFRNNIVGTGYHPIGMPKTWGREIDYNLFPDAAALARSKALGLDEHSAAGDPKFINPAAGDYRVRDDSPALKLGFKNFPMDQFGVTSPKLRAVARTPRLPGQNELIAVAKSARDDRPQPWLGATVKNVTGMGEVSAAGLPGEVGVLVTEVPAGTRAETAGLEKGDVVLTVDGKPVADVADLVRRYYALPPGKTTELGLFRTQREKKLKLDRGREIYLSAGAATPTGEKPFPVYDAAKDFLGSWRTAGAALAWKMGVPAGIYEVWAVVACQPGSAGSRYVVTVGGKDVPGTVAATRGWEDFATVRVGSLALDQTAAGPVTLRPVSKPADAVMNLRGLILIPSR